MVDIQSPTAEIRRGKKEQEEEEEERKKKPQDENIMPASATQGGHNININTYTTAHTGKNTFKHADKQSNV